jgi:hypothetical protein
MSIRNLVYVVENGAVEEANLLKLKGIQRDSESFTS